MATEVSCTCILHPSIHPKGTINKRLLESSTFGRVNQGIWSKNAQNLKTCHLVSFTDVALCRHLAAVALKSGRVAHISSCIMHNVCVCVCVALSMGLPGSVMCLIAVGFNNSHRCISLMPIIKE